MTDELVKRLRGLRVDGTPVDVTMGQAADEIERLRALVGRMLPYVQRWESADAAELEAQASIEDEAERVLYATHEPLEQRAIIYGTLTARDPSDVTRTLWTRTGNWVEAP